MVRVFFTTETLILEGEECYGIYSPKHHTITIEYPPTGRIRVILTLIHELGHYIVDLLTTDSKNHEKISDYIDKFDDNLPWNIGKRGP